MGSGGLTLSEWKGDQFEKLLNVKLERRLDAVGFLLENDLKAELSAKGNITGYDPSLPGEPPAKVTGRLAGSITHVVDYVRLILRVGSPVIYGKFLETGTRKMAARPWLRPIFRKNMEAIKKIFSGK